MKKWFVIVGMLLAFVLGGCATTKPAYHATVKEDVYIDHTHTWSNSPYGKYSSVRSITLRVINKKYAGVHVTVTCKYVPGDTVFGERTVWIPQRDDKVFTVRGFARLTPEPESVGCQITCVK